MIYHITYNEKRLKQATPVKNREEFLALRNSKENLENLAKARAGDSEAKANLVQFAYNLGHVEGLLAGCKSIGSYFFHDIDCYDQSESEAMAKQILSKKDEIDLMFLERSASGGFHAVCKRMPGTTILENQVRIATILQIEMDTNTKDLQRVAYGSSGSPEDLLYLDDELFGELMTAEECEAEYARLKQRERRGEEQVPPTAKKARKHYKPWEEGDVSTALDMTSGKAALGMTASVSSRPSEARGEISRDTSTTRGMTKEEGKKEYPKEYHGIPYETILAKYWELNNGGYEPTIGDRDTLTFQLASDLRHICGKNADWLDQVIPCYDGFSPEEKRQKIANALASKYEGMPSRLKDVLDALGITNAKNKPNAIVNHAEQENLAPAEYSSELSRLFASDTPPEIPDKRPKLVDVVICNTPQKYKATVAQAMFPGLMAYPRKLSFVYIDNQVRDLRANCLIVAGTGAGKDSCTKQPLAHIIADMKQRDEENRHRLKEFNDKCNAMGSNKQKPQRPDDLIIQTIKSDITKAALVQRMDEAQGAPLYVRINELEQWDKIEGASGRGNQFTTLKLCDDEGNDYGTDRAGTQSVTGSGCLHLNWNANTTIAKAIKYFRYVLTDGPISRLCLATIPEDEIGADVSVFGNYGKAYDAALKPYIDNLKKATGVIDCKEAKKLARKLKDECADFARQSQDRVFDNLSHRALVLAFRKACMLYAANGMKWEKSIETFCRWSLFYDLYIKMTVFGELIRHADDDIRTSKRGPQSLLDLLPVEFTLEDAKRVRLKQGFDDDERHTKKMIRNWANRDFVIQNSEFSFVKIKINKKNGTDSTAK